MTSPKRSNMRRTSSGLEAGTAVVGARLQRAAVGGRRAAASRCRPHCVHAAASRRAQTTQAGYYSYAALPWVGGRLGSPLLRVDLITQWSLTVTQCSLMHRSHGPPPLTASPAAGCGSAG